MWKQKVQGQKRGVAHVSSTIRFDVGGMIGVDRIVDRIVVPVTRESVNKTDGDRAETENRRRSVSAVTSGEHDTIPQNTLTQQQSQQQKE